MTALWLNPADQIVEKNLERLIALLKSFLPDDGG
jgi:hypothetical protein